MVTNLEFYLVAIPAVLIAGISKSGFGGGLGIMAVPLMAVAISPITAAAIMLPLLVIMDLFSAYIYRDSWDRKNLIVLIPAAIFGVIIGTATFKFFDHLIVTLILSLIALWFSGSYWGQEFRWKKNESRSTTTVEGAFWGTVAGFTSFVSHAGGPPLNAYLLPQQMEKKLFIGTTVIFFFVINYIKLVPYAWLGQLNTGNLATSLTLAPIVPVGIWAGIKLRDYVTEKLFYRLCYGLLFITGLKLLSDVALQWSM